MIKRLLTLILSFLYFSSNAQLIDAQDIPDFKYTRKRFVVKEDSIRFKNTPILNNTLSRTYEMMNLSFFDLDDSKKIISNIQQNVLVCIEGYYSGNQKIGNFILSIMDSFHPEKKFKIWEQSFKSGKLNGYVKAYTLEGKLAAQYEYKDDSLQGKSVLYGADGKTVVEEINYGSEPGKYIRRVYNDTSGKLMREEIYERYDLNGKARDFYANGQVEMEEFYIDGELNGTRRHFYPSGNRWTEVEYRNGKPWMALGSYLENGKPLFPGTLGNGTGVLHIYDKYGVIQESYMYMKGEFVK